MPAVVRAFAGAILACVAACSLCSCEKPAPPPSSAGPASPAPLPVQTYTVKGKVAQLPDPAVKGSMFQVAHEDIPTFVRKDGTLGMNAMTMPFPPAAGLSLQGLAVGDEIELTFEVRWDRIPPQQAVAVRKLPPANETRRTGPS